MHRFLHSTKAKFFLVIVFIYCSFSLGAIAAQIHAFGLGLTDKAEFIGFQCGDPSAGLRKCCTLPTDPEVAENVNQTKSGTSTDDDIGYVRYGTSMKSDPGLEASGSAVTEVGGPDTQDHKESIWKLSQTQYAALIDSFTLDQISTLLVKNTACGITDYLDKKNKETKDSNGKRIDDWIDDAKDDGIIPTNNLSSYLGNSKKTLPDSTLQSLSSYVAQRSNPSVTIDFIKYQEAAHRCQGFANGGIFGAVKRFPGNVIDAASNVVQDLFVKAPKYVYGWVSDHLIKPIGRTFGSFDKNKDSTKSVDYRCKDPSVSSTTFKEQGIDPDTLLTDEAKKQKSQEGWDKCYCVLPDELDFTKLPDTNGQSLNSAAASMTYRDLIEDNKGLIEKCKSIFSGASFKSCATFASSKFVQLLNSCNKIGNAGEVDACKACLVGVPNLDATVKSVKTDLTIEGMWTSVGCVPTDLSSFVQRALNVWMLGIAGGLAFGILMYASFLYTTSRGNPEKLKKAREYLNSALLGLLLVIFSVFILQLFGVTILQLPGISK